MMGFLHPVFVSVVCTVFLAGQAHSSGTQCKWVDAMDMEGNEEQRAAVKQALSLDGCKAECDADLNCDAVSFAGSSCELFYHSPQALVKINATYSFKYCYDVVEGPGPVCTARGQRCLNTATCDTEKNHCQCPHDTHGNGMLECVPKSNALCTVDRDPHVRTWDGAAADVDLPCAYTVTQIVSGVCDFKIVAANKLTADGLFFVNDVEVVFRVLTIEEGEVKTLMYSQRTMTVSSDDLRNMTEGTKPWKNIQSGVVEQSDVVIINEWDDDNKFAILDFPSCNVRIKFRPRLAGLQPGLTISAPKNATFPSANSCVCQTPRGGGHSLQAMKDQSRFSRLANALIWMIFSEEGSAGIQDRFPLCKAVEKQYGACGSVERVVATELCGPVYTDRNMLKCLLKGGYKAESVYLSCVTWVCDRDVSRCQEYRNVTTACRPSQLMDTVACNVTTLESQIVQHFQQ